MSNFVFLGLHDTCACSVASGFPWAEISFSKDSIKEITATGVVNEGLAAN